MIYCPNCRGEFRDGIVVCKKCNCGLVTLEELAPLCPVCKKTFDNGISICPYCQSKTMITEFDDDHHDEKIEYRYVELITVYEAANEGELAFVKGLLESNEIDYYAKGEYIAPIEGLGSVGGFNPLFGPITVQVAPDDVEKAKVIIDEFINNKNV